MHPILELEGIGDNVCGVAQVGARTERVAGSGDHGASDIRIDAHALEDRADLLEHRPGHRVLLLRAIECDRDHVGFLLPSQR
jgi:hypothetical protein